MPFIVPIGLLLNHMKNIQIKNSKKVTFLKNFYLLRVTTYMSSFSIYFINKLHLVTI
jgi:hypothetical protein